MDAVIPWQRLLARIEPYYPKPGRGRQPLGLEKMLRIYFVQQWFDLLSDPGAEALKQDGEPGSRERPGLFFWVQVDCSTAQPRGGGLRLQECV